MLASRIGSFEGLTVIDLFAGSGALGLEALSRGAAHCTFVETRSLRGRCPARQYRDAQAPIADIRAQGHRELPGGPYDLALRATRPIGSGAGPEGARRM